MVYLKTKIKLFVLITDVVRHNQCSYQWGAGTCLSVIFTCINRHFSYLKTWWIPFIIIILFWDQLHLQRRPALTFKVFEFRCYIQSHNVGHVWPKEQEFYQLESAWKPVLALICFADPEKRKLTHLMPTKGLKVKINKIIKYRYFVIWRIYTYFFFLKWSKVLWNLVL